MGSKHRGCWLNSADALMVSIHSFFGSLVLARAGCWSSHGLTDGIVVVRLPRPVARRHLCRMAPGRSIHYLQLIFPAGSPLVA